MTWTVKAGGAAPLLVECIKAQAVWRKLTPAGRETMTAAYTDGIVVGHPKTKRALADHGLISFEDSVNGHLTEAGRIVASWNTRQP